MREDISENSRMGWHTIADVRQISGNAFLGLKKLSVRSGKITAVMAREFLGFLEKLAADAGPFDVTRDHQFLPRIDDARVSWSRLSFTLYPVYVERLTIVASDQFPSPDDPVPLIINAPGEWTVCETALLPGANHHNNCADLWRATFSAEPQAAERLSGGLALNAIEIPHAALASGEVDLRPLQLHALNDSGDSCDRGNLGAQAAIANAFWQTYWATGALRSERGTTFPIAFLPIDRSWRGEHDEPWRERKAPQNRTYYGRTSILAHIHETLTRARALFFDTQRLRFEPTPDFDPAKYDINPDDVKLAISELNRTGFPDAYTGANSQLLPAWRGHEEGFDCGVYDAAPKSADHKVRIHRVVPYAGCAFLSEVVNHTSELRKCGKIRGFGDRILAATNSTFFLNFPEEYASLHSAMNDPAALLIEAGRIHQTPAMRRATFVLYENGDTAITVDARISFPDSGMSEDGPDEAMQVFSCFHKSGQSFRNNSAGPCQRGSVIVGDSVTGTFSDSCADIPANGIVIDRWLTPPLRGAIGVSLPPNTDQSKSKVRHAFAAGPLLVDKHQIVPLGASGEQFQPIVLRANPSAEETSELARTQLPPSLLDCECRGVPPTRFPYDWNDTRAPRTALGMRDDGSVLLVVVDGRADLAHSIGVTLAELAQIMLNLGCCSAMNMDGGGSSVMFVNDPRVQGMKLRDELRDGVVNLPSDRGGVERLLPVPLIVCLRK